MSTDAANPGRSGGRGGPPVRAAAAWWKALPGRERRLLMLAAGVLGGYAAFAIAIQPAWRTLARAPGEIEKLESQLQRMQRLASETRELRAAPPVNPEQAAAALKVATERLGPRGRLALQGDRAVLTLEGVASNELRDWFAEARSGARARPVEARLSRGNAGYSGTIVLALGSGS